jgi:hypothetical protein
MTDRELFKMVLDTLSMAVEPKKGKVYALEFQPIDCAAMHLKVIEALRARLAQPDVPETAFGETEPVAWISHNAGLYHGKPDESLNPLPLYTAPPRREWEILVESVRQMRDVQGKDGNWNCDPYMHGLFNGIEFALSLIEVREPKFRDAPEKWLCDQPKARIFSGGGNNG